MAYDFPQMAHWKLISIRWDRMREIMYYHVDAPRHCDGGSKLFHPHKRLPDDGALMLAANGVNLPMDKKTKKPLGLVDGPIGKHFCLTGVPHNIHTCNETTDKDPFNHHIKNIHQGDVILMAFNTVIFRPHKTEHCNKGKTIMTLARNKYPIGIIEHFKREDMKKAKKKRGLKILRWRPRKKKRLNK